MKSPATDPLPNTAGIGLRAPHYREVLQSLPKLGWVEVHSENFFGGGAPLHTLLKVREHYPVSLHGVGMGLASVTPLDQEHLSALKRLCDVVQPAAVSEHLCWNAAPDFTGKQPIVINDLLPFPYTQAALSNVAMRIEQVQEKLGCKLLVENLSSYLSFSHSDMNEGEFLAELSRRTGCGILFDVNYGFAPPFKPWHEDSLTIVIRFYRLQCGFAKLKRFDPSLTDSFRCMAIFTIC